MQKYIIIYIFILLVGCSSKYQAMSSDIIESIEVKSDYDNNIEYEVEILPVPDIEIASKFIDANDILSSKYYEEFKEFNIPVEMTSRVSSYINYFTKRIPDTTQSWLNRSNKYMYIVRDIFIKEGLPTDLVVLAFTESGYNTHALSKAGAVGMWQFIPSTARLYGMNENFWLDERRDFEKATYAAARYLKELYSIFGDWYLALAAYNAGPGKISRATKKHKSKNFFQISKNKYTLKLETRDYVPKFLAQLIIYKNYLKYGFTPPTEMPLLYDSILVTSGVNLYWLADKMQIDVKKLQELNPALKLPMTPANNEYNLRVPYKSGEKAKYIINSSTVSERMVYKVYNARQGESILSIANKYKVSVASIKQLNSLKSDKIFISRPIFVGSEVVNDIINKDFSKYLSNITPKYYRVKRGDTFIQIAHKHNMRQYDLQRLNPNVKPNRIYPGQFLAISNGTTIKKSIKNRSSIKKLLSNKGKVIKYKIKSGDSLWSIAKKFGSTVNQIKSMNNLQSEFLATGKILIIKL